ncbi:auxin efflux carrier component 6 isoform X2 [Henckelia pumila]|uniref:auxin efflux carrier component 6 isoform X2 n=1 Tax=Henckelia pumila TaxID=405737 RepID=UPI003C6E89C8
MISTDDFYKVMCAMVPLYFAMLVAYVSVKFCNIFSPEQCSGINRFVAVFAVPVLSFHFISQNNPYEMDTKFILADTISKFSVLVLLSVWCIFKGKLEWLITIFSVSTLPNTLVMGIPLLKAMYGDFTQPIMVQLVVLQCILWYTLLLFLFEYRAATILIKTQFPGGAAAAVTKFDVENDVISLDGRDPLLTDSEIDDAGRIIRVRIRRSTTSSAARSSSPRASNLSNAEIFSINTPHEFGLGFRPFSPRVSGYASSDAYSLQPTPRTSSFNGMDSAATSPAAGKVSRQPSPAVKIPWESPSDGSRGDVNNIVGDKDLSFRDCLKIPVEEGPDMKGVPANQELPRAVVMLRLILIVVGRKLSRNPNTYSSVLGLLWSLISFKWDVGMPSVVKYSIKIISDAGLGMAMFSLGLFMALQPRIIACGFKMGAISMVVRFIGGPILMSAASLAIGLKGVHLHAAIVQLFHKELSHLCLLESMGCIQTY